MRKKVSHKKVQDQSIAWLYSPKVKDHFFNPRNLLQDEKDLKFKPNAIGRVGSPACGDEMVFYLYIDPKTEKIKKCHWRTFGCASAIASTSVLSEMVTKNGGMPIEEALKIRPQDIVKKLGGLPPQKIHCSVLGDRGLRAAIEDYRARQPKEK